MCRAHLEREQGGEAGRDKHGGEEHLIHRHAHEAALEARGADHRLIEAVPVVQDGPNHHEALGSVSHRNSVRHGQRDNCSVVVLTFSHHGSC